MKAWQLERLGGELRFNSVRTPEPRPGSALVRIEASALMSHLKAYVEGKLPVYNPPPGPFTIGTNGVGVVEAVGRDVWHLKPGQRVVLSSHFVAAENVDIKSECWIVDAFYHERLRAEDDLSRHLRSGTLKPINHVVDGFENLPSAVVGLYTTSRSGKLQVRFDAK